MSAMHDQNRYPVNESNGLTDPQAYHAQVTHRIERDVLWTEPGLHITRLRLLTERGFPAFDVSYCHGEINGEPVNVQLPFDQLPRKGTHRAIIAHAKRDGVYAKGLGILDNISILFG